MSSLCIDFKIPFISSSFSLHWIYKTPCAGAGGKASPLRYSVILSAIPVLLRPAAASIIAS